MRFFKSLKIFLIIFLVGGFVGCKVAGDMQEETRSIELGSAESVEINLKIAVGELRVRGGASDLMEGYFAYNIKKWKPEIEYDEFNDRGTLKVKQGKYHRMNVGKKRNKWDISLNNDVPLDIQIDFGVGQGKLDLRGLIIKSFNIDMGVGELTVDLSGEQKQDLDVVIDGGIGSVTLYLPEHIGVRANIDRGIGSVDARDFDKRGSIYTNDAYGKTEVTIYVDIDAGIGSIDLRLK
ncbi:MAG: toast rack family protein [Candidatus Aminicenantaceae bacterium]